MRWRQAKKIVKLDGKETCPCGGRVPLRKLGDRDHMPECRGRGGRPRRRSAYARISPRQWERLWVQSDRRRAHAERRHARKEWAC